MGDYDALGINSFSKFVFLPHHKLNKFGSVLNLSKYMS